MAEAAPLRGPFDEPRYVGNSEGGVVVDADHSEVGLECGEGVVGDSGACGGDHADQGALADIREPDQSDIGHEANLEPEPSLLAMLALLGKGWRTATIRQETGITATATATSNCHPPVTMIVQLGKDLPGVHIAYHRALGHRDLKALPTSTVKVLTFSMHTVTSTPVWMVSKGEQRRHIVVGDQPDVATIATITTIWAAVHHGAFTPKRHAPGPSVTSAEVQLTFVDELRHVDTLPSINPARREGAAPGS